MRELEEEIIKIGLVIGLVSFLLILELVFIVVKFSVVFVCVRDKDGEEEG